MLYDLYVDEDKVGNGLSKGELNQWILDLYSELNESEKFAFRKEFGVNNEDNFEDFIYENEIICPLKVKHKDNIITINENEFS